MPAADTAMAPASAVSKMVRRLSFKRRPSSDTVAAGVAREKHSAAESAEPSSSSGRRDAVEAHATPSTDLAMSLQVVASETVGPEQVGRHQPVPQGALSKMVRSLSFSRQKSSGGVVAARDANAENEPSATLPSCAGQGAPAIVVDAHAASPGGEQAGVALLPDDQFPDVAAHQKVVWQLEIPRAWRPGGHLRVRLPSQLELLLLPPSGARSGQTLYFAVPLAETVARVDGNHDYRPSAAKVMARKLSFGRSRKASSEQSSFREVDLYKETKGALLGVHVAEVAPGHERAAAGGVVVAQMSESGLAARSKKVRCGDTLHAVNGVKVTGHEQAAWLLREAVGVLQLVRRARLRPLPPATLCPPPALALCSEIRSLSRRGARACRSGGCRTVC